MVVPRDLDADPSWLPPPCFTSAQAKAASSDPRPRSAFHQATGSRHLGLLRSSHQGAVTALAAEGHHRGTEFLAPTHVRPPPSHWHRTTLGSSSAATSRTTSTSAASHYRAEWPIRDAFLSTFTNVWMCVSPSSSVGWALSAPATWLVAASVGQTKSASPSLLAARADSRGPCSLPAFSSLWWLLRIRVLA
jgi:hypothetical protein|uniref:Uncharacterized protein n=1 Tax=Zea mays TaxID=4577 RepID=A0A804QLD7_MAIZE